MMVSPKQKLRPQRKLAEQEKAERRKRREAQRAADKNMPINPDRFYTISEVAKFRFFGCGPTALNEKIKSGELPPPIRSFKSSRQAGWYGRTIQEIQKKIEEDGSALYQDTKQQWGAPLHSKKEIAAVAAVARKKAKRHVPA
jgi:hypothetical protein